MNIELRHLRRNAYSTTPREWEAFLQDNPHISLPDIKEAVADGVREHLDVFRAASEQILGLWDETAEDALDAGNRHVTLTHLIDVLGAFQTIEDALNTVELVACLARAASTVEAMACEAAHNEQ